MLQNTPITSTFRDLSLKTSGMPTEQVQLHHLCSIECRGIHCTITCPWHLLQAKNVLIFQIRIKETSNPKNYPPADTHHYYFWQQHALKRILSGSQNQAILYASLRKKLQVDVRSVSNTYPRFSPLGDGYNMDIYVMVFQKPRMQEVVKGAHEQSSQGAVPG